MTPAELYKLCKKQQDHGLRRIPLTMPAPKSWGNRVVMQRKVRTPFGLCEYGHTGDRNKIVVWADVGRVMNWIKKVAFEVIEEKSAG